jgi:hypothetical protein
MKLATFTVALLAYTCTVPAAAKTGEHNERFADEILLPFHLNKEGYPLIDGAVDGKPGVFLLDTGESDRFLLNRNYVSFDLGVQVGGGTFASGQTVVLLRHQGLHTADLSGVLKIATGSGDSKAPDATLSIDARQQQKHIDPRLLGWLGWGFLKEYVTTIDYRSGLVRLIPVATAPPAAHTRTSLVVSFTPSSPVIPFTAEVGGYVTPAILDTAGWDQLSLQPASWAKVKALNVTRARPGVSCIAIDSATVGGQRVDLIDLELVE